MNQRKLIFLALSVVVVLILTVCSVIAMLNSTDTTIVGYIIVFIGLIIYLVYSVKNILLEYNIYKTDKIEGLEREIVEFCDLKTILNVDIKYPKDTTPIATFKILKKNEYISLSWNYSRINLVKRKKYVISFYRHSRMLVDIREAHKVDKIYNV